MKIDPGTFVWHDVSTTAVEDAVAFYRDVIGWTVHHEDGPRLYPKLCRPEGPVCGVLELAEEALAVGAPPHWLSYVAVADVGEAAGLAARSGAHLLVPPRESDAGDFCVLADPQGAVLGLFTPSLQLHTSDGSVGSVVFSVLTCGSPHAAAEFYESVLSWSFEERGDALVFSGSRPLGAVRPLPASVKQAGWLPYVAISDLGSVTRRVQELGGAVLQTDAQEASAICVDRQGAAFGLRLICGDKVGSATAATGS